MVTGDEHGEAAHGAGGLRVRRIPIGSLGSVQREAWSQLHETQRQPAMPFSSPDWVIAWLQHYVPARDQRLLFVFDGERLVGVAPMVIRRMRLLGLPIVRRLVLAGGGVSTPLEVPQVLSAPGYGRAVVRALVSYTATEPASWAELSIGADQGWINPGAFAGQLTPLPFMRHQRTHVCVVKELAETWPQTRSGLRRNARESLRRARNRLNKDGRPWKIVHLAGPDLDRDAVSRWLGLHAARSRFAGSWSKHGDAYADPADRAFMLALLPQLARRGQASMMELELDGRPVAAQLVLHAPGTIYFHSSGFVPDEWRLSPITALLGAAMEVAIEHGTRWVNFSPGANESKLRWSEELDLRHEFAYGRGGVIAGAKFAAFALLQELVQLRVAAQMAAAEVAGVRPH